MSSSPLRFFYDCIHGNICHGEITPKSTPFKVILYSIPIIVVKIVCEVSKDKDIYYKIHTHYLNISDTILFIIHLRFVHP